ncbi:PASTA domain-containing protein [Kribbella kalugense]|uniref:PASTA domain-containing protein n=1 Tax=Kribbella kalugense TaxID=2512221 RepID=A0A4R7ZWG1_9ACTN|nr:PASTA domain-containing protein [Kribbella kalugense]TDW21421.1 PASTA domain-containing protein [Kribbella kalugense]
MTARRWVGLVSGLLFLLVACGTSGTPGSVVTVTATTVTTVTAAPSSAQPSVQSGVVPNVVGMNHQLAQDTMQAAGFYNLAEEDATGQGRLLINDRNWVVVTQTPAGGTHAAPDTKITLRSKKIGE